MKNMEDLETITRKGLKYHHEETDLSYCRMLIDDIWIDADTEELNKR